ncbi:hypothetical protein C882_0138 [Caenispirillum salinarum AK4]|uniref:DUF5666 domain-containing protein n=1 Tax=Caenispirillum salinarum AK4 TaxID=1238182 RepID=K9GXR8_9PROT|nr:DUF6152 family protein [Caenispirillum salinarum]EKV30057.1 hypothetical protein C882_0138 [Caenispirillum salinarum AK4]
MRLARTLLAAAVLAAAMPAAATAHHGWRWTEGENTRLTGTITAVKLGNPHGEVTLDVAGTAWLVEVGQPWRNDRAGLTPEKLVEGVEMTVIGETAADADRKVIKAERVIIDGTEHVLYPERD